GWRDSDICHRQETCFVVLGKGLDVSREKLYRGGFGGFRSVVWIWNSGAGILCAGEYSLKICLEVQVVAEGLEKNQDSSFGESQEDMEEDARIYDEIPIAASTEIDNEEDWHGNIMEQVELYHTEEDGIVLENYDNQIDFMWIKLTAITNKERLEAPLISQEGPGGAKPEKNKKKGRPGKQGMGQWKIGKTSILLLRQEKNSHNIDQSLMNMFNEFINLYKLREIILKRDNLPQNWNERYRVEKELENVYHMEEILLRENFWEGRSELSIEESFLVGLPRNILEGVVILHEKAYDKVRLNFLAEWRMGKQGDPLSPLLFNLVFVNLGAYFGENEEKGSNDTWKFFPVKHLFKWGAINKLTHGRDEVVWGLEKIYIKIFGNPSDRCALCQKQETQIMLEKKVEEVHIRKTMLETSQRFLEEILEVFFFFLE
ncbi:hypothetical protein ACJX0J_014446, partial [Zea mays]